MLYATVAISQNTYSPTINIYRGETLPLINENTLIAGYIQLELTEIEKLVERLNMVLSNIDSNITAEILLDKLADCESGLNPDICIIDINGKLSCGLYMFQKQTFLNYCKGEWINPENQTECTINMILKGLGHTTIGWQNCWKIANLPIIITQED